MRLDSKHLIASAGVALVLLVAGCGGEGGSTTVLQTETVTSEAAPAPQDESNASSPEPSEDEPTESAGGSGNIEVPDVVGEDHQLAQDTMQAAGLYLLEEEDATGQGRALIVDRNWTVVEQSPPAGTKVSEDETILLKSKKDGE
jgi:hypothetical protein